MLDLAGTAARGVLRNNATFVSGSSKDVCHSFAIQWQVATL